MERTGHPVTTPPARAAAAARRRPRAGASAFAWGLAFFLAWQVAFLLASSRAPELIYPEYGRKLHLLRARLAEEPGRPLVLALGSSRTAVGLRPECFPSPATGKPPLVFNFGLTGAGPVMQLLCLQRLLAAGIRPDRLLLEFLPLQFYPAVRVEDQLHVDRLGWPELSLLKAYGGRNTLAPAQWCLSRLTACHTYRHCFQARCTPSWLPYTSEFRFWARLDRNGWLPGVYVEEKEPETARRRLDKALRDYAYLGHVCRLEGDMDTALRDLLALSRREGIAVTLVLTPEGSVFQKLYHPAMRSQIDTHVAALGRKFGAEVIDARDWCPDEEFDDGHHLMARGAARFSERLGREVFAPPATARASR